MPNELFYELFYKSRKKMILLFLALNTKDDL